MVVALLRPMPSTLVHAIDGRPAPPNTSHAGGIGQRRRAGRVDFQDSRICVSKRSRSGQDSSLPQSLNRRTAMKKQATSDAKKRAANDVETNDTPKATAAKAPKAKPASDQRYELGSIATVKRGFLLAFVEFTKKKGS